MTSRVLLASKHRPSLDVSPGSELPSVLFPVEQGGGFRARGRQNWFAQGWFINRRFPSPHPWLASGWCCSRTAAPSQARRSPAWGCLLSRLPHPCHPEPQELQFLADASRTPSSSPTAAPAPASARLGGSRMMPSRAEQPLLQPLHSVCGAMALGTSPLSTTTVPTGKPPWRSSMLAPGIRAPPASAG